MVAPLDIEGAIGASTRRFTLDDVVEAMIRRESAAKPGARGRKGEVGLAQIMPATAAEYGITPEALRDPNVNRMVAKRYLGDLLRRYGGDLRKAITAYNAGPGRVGRGVVPASSSRYADEIINAVGGAPAMRGPSGPARPVAAAIPSRTPTPTPTPTARPSPTPGARPAALPAHHYDPFTPEELHLQAPEAIPFPPSPEDLHLQAPEAIPLPRL